MLEHSTGTFLTILLSFSPIIKGAEPVLIKLIKQLLLNIDNGRVNSSVDGNKDTDDNDASGKILLSQAALGHPPNPGQPQIS